MTQYDHCLQLVFDIFIMNTGAKASKLYMVQLASVSSGSVAPGVMVLWISSSLGLWMKLRREQENDWGKNGIEL